MSDAPTPDSNSPTRTGAPLASARFACPSACLSVRRLPVGAGDAALRKRGGAMLQWISRAYGARKGGV